MVDILGAEGRKATNACVKITIFKKPKKLTCYDRKTAITRVRGCYTKDIDVDWDKIFNADERICLYIFDVRNAIVHLDERYKEEKLEVVKEQREDVETEYIDFFENIEILEHGSGTVIQNHFVVTCRHVIETALNDGNLIFVSNAKLKQYYTGLFCKVIHDDLSKDLALLHCPKLNVNGICPLQLSVRAQTGWTFHCFGYPKSHSGETALYVNGVISGTDLERYGRPPLMVLCCQGLNHGFSGSPVVVLDDGKVCMIGVVKEKQITQMLTTEDEEFIAKVETKYRTEARDVDDLKHEVVLTKLDEILCKMAEWENNYPSGLINAITGATVQQFINEAIISYQGWDSNELSHILKE